MHWKNIIVDSVDSSLPREDSCRTEPAACWQPEDESDMLVEAQGSDSSCELESRPTEVCQYTTGEYVFRIGDHIEQTYARAGTLIIEVSCPTRQPFV